jgi:hypothetical protein
MHLIVNDSGNQVFARSIYFYVCRARDGGSNFGDPSGFDEQVGFLDLAPVYEAGVSN